MIKQVLVLVLIGLGFAGCMTAHTQTVEPTNTSVPIAIAEATPSSTATEPPAATSTQVTPPTATATLVATISANTPSPEPTNTPTTTATSVPPTSTFTPVPVSTQAPTAQPTNPPTLPPATQVPTRIPVLPTATATAIDTVTTTESSTHPAMLASQNYIRISPQTIRVGEPFEIEWSFDPQLEVTNIYIEGFHYYSGQVMGRNLVYANGTVLPSTGRQSMKMGVAVGDITVVFAKDSPAAPIEIMQPRILCPEGWFYKPSDDAKNSTCPNWEQTATSLGSQQEFERGYMIWMESRDSILVVPKAGTVNALLNENERHWFWKQDHYDAAVDPVEDERIVPPTGLLQPQYGFGKLWRENSDVREALGWAVAPAPLYTIVYQQSFKPKGYLPFNYLRMLHGPVVVWDNHGYLQIDDSLDGYSNPAFPR